MLLQLYAHAATLRAAHFHSGSYCITTWFSFGLPMLALIALFAALLTPAWGGKPNIVFYVMDDLGWSDVQYHDPRKMFIFVDG